MATVNLWPDEIATDGGLEGPATVLKEQAALLGQKTKNLVEADVESNSSEDDSGRFWDHFVIFSSVINYRYMLFVVSYPFEFYPATIYWDGYPEKHFVDIDGDTVRREQSQNVASRAELEEELKRIFSHPKTIRIIQALISRTRQ